MALPRASWLRHLLVISCLSIAAVHSAARASELLVPAQYPTIQAALDAAIDGDKVLVSAGTYLENISIAKSVSVTGVSGPAETVIDGQSNDSVVRILASQVQFIGFTLRNGDALDGGGLNITAGGATIENCWIMSNQAEEHGGGIYSQVGPINIISNRIENNKAFIEGGGIDFSDETGSDVSRIEGNTIEGNYAAEEAGGLNVGGATPRVVGNIFRNNQTWSAGGGVFFQSPGKLVVANNLFVGNSARRGGGIAYQSSSPGEPGLWVNNTIVDNPGGGLFLVGERPAPQMFANNIIRNGNRAIDCQMSGMKFERNDVIGHVDTSCSNARRGSNFSNVNPKFKAGQQGDFRLERDSPLIDAGSNRFAIEAGLDRDLAGHHRIIDGGLGKKVDIGAFEHKPR